MAEAVVSAVVGDAVTGNLCQQRSSEAKLQRISRLLVRIHSVVEEAKARQIENQGVLQWLLELIDGEYEGRYLLDNVGRGEHELDDDERAHDSQVPLPQASSALSLFNPAKRMRVVASAVKTALSRRAAGAGETEIDRVLESLEAVSSDLAEFIMLLQGYKKRIRRPLATNIFLDGQMFGRHVEKERVINFLVHDDSVGGDSNLGVLPIVGDIGVGKTTLLQHACDDPRVRGHFPVIVLLKFACTYATATSEAATVVLRSKHVIGEAEAGSVDMNDPLKLIQSCFGNKKRFLMVFEDVDTRKRQVLEELLPVLRRGAASGSRVIFTTNNRRVASQVGTVQQPVVLKALPHPEYWFFFKAHAFAGRDVEEDPRLVAAGKAIARKLSGSFFGAKIVGGLLRDRPDPRFWCKVLRSSIGGLSLLGDGIDYIADLAENLLPDHVAVCHVTVSKDRYPSQMELAKFRDLCEPPGSGEAATCLTDDVSFARVLLCKSVLPFYNQHYYIVTAL